MDLVARAPKLLGVGLALGLVALGLKWFAGANAGAGGRGGSQAGSMTGPGRSAPVVGGRSDRGASAGGSLIVQVAGLVRHPGVYRLPLGARTYQAIEAAGGSQPRGNPGALQLAARLADGARVDVPPRAVAGTAPGSAAGRGPGQATGLTGPVSLSSATAEQLDSLDGIGPALAKRIIEWRQAHGGFGSVADLDRVPGIGPAKYEAIKGSVVP